MIQTTQYTKTILIVSIAILLGLGIVFQLASQVVYAADQTVVVSNFQFTEANITIDVGDTVTWENQGGFHNVASTSGPTAFRNGEASASNWTYEHTFDVAGEYEYVCEIHDDMVGTITVNEPSIDPTPTPQPTETQTSQPVETSTPTPQPTESPVPPALEQFVYLPVMIGE